MKKKQYISGSSLTETIVAITIITICSLLGVMAYVAVLNSSPSPQGMEYEYEMEKLISETIDEKNTASFVKDIGKFKISKEVIEKEEEGLYHIKFSIKSQRKKLEKEIIIYKAKNNG